MSVVKTPATHVMDPRVMGTAGQVGQVALVAVCLALERDVAVGIATHAQPDQPLHHIGQVKEHEQHLALLSSVDALVIDQFIAQVHPGVDKHHPQQVDG